MVRSLPLGQSGRGEDAFDGDLVIAETSHDEDVGLGLVRGEDLAIWSGHIETLWSIWRLVRGQQTPRDLPLTKNWLLGDSISFGGMGLLL